jgi:acyl-CoA synthetase (AMP-forming)/AMP-acid ligase II/aryl carrier-like protein
MRKPVRPPYRPRCIPHLMAHQARYAPDALAILAPGRLPLTYGRLYRHMDDIVSTLHTMDVGRQDRVALVLPNGPEMAVAFLAVAAGATCVPLNPAYSAEEFDRYLAALNAQVLMFQAGMDSPGRAVAQARGLRLIELSPRLEAEAGLFTLASEGQMHATPSEVARPDDAAVILQSSGTTSQPKIVPLTHATICTWARDVCNALDLVPGDRCLNMMPLFHGHGLLITTLASLMAGASLVCTPGFCASQFIPWLAEFRPTWYSASPTLHQAILTCAAPHRDLIARYPLRFIRSSSAALPPQVHVELESLFQAPLIEGYGMTEAHVQASCNPLPPRQRKIGSVGIAAGLQVAIMDEMGGRLPANCTGEVVVRGARGRQDNATHPTINLEAATPDWYRTGDLGYLDAEAYLFITGRLKDMINRGGEKILPQEVDAVLQDHPAVAQAVTFAVPHARLGEDVAAAVVLHPNTRATAADIRQFAVAHLAAFKVPSQIYTVAELPQSPTGKVQRHRLAAQFAFLASDQAPAEQQASLVPPRTPYEELLAGLWAQVLDLQRVGITDDFFSLGGDSISAMQLVSRVRERLHVDLSWRRFFETPTVEGMARSIAAVRQAHQGTPEPPLVPIPRQGALPVTVAQEQLWRLDQILPGTPLFNVLYTIRLTGSLNVVALEHSLNELIARHEVLRTTFMDVEGSPRQSISPALHLPLTVVDLGAVAESERQETAQRLAREAALRPFDLGRGPLLRAHLLRLDEQAHLLLLTLHNMISDAWSSGTLVYELAVLYDACCQGKSSPLPALPIQYADFASWQHQWRHSKAWEAQMAYWQQQLRDPLPMLELPADRPRTAALSFRTACQPLELPAGLSASLTHLSHRESCTLFMTLLAGLATLLHGYTGQEDLIIGSLFANRHRQEVAALIGPCVNTVLLRTDLSGDPTFLDLLQRVRATMLAAYAHQDLPFGDLIQTLETERGLDRRSLCQVMCILHRAAPQPPPLPALTLRLLEAAENVVGFDFTATTFDVILVFQERPQGLAGSCIYKTTRFDDATIERMLKDFQHLLARLVSQPERPLSTFGVLWDQSEGGDL